MTHYFDKLNNSYVRISFFLAYRPGESVYADYVSIKIILQLDHQIQDISEFWIIKKIWN